MPVTKLNNGALVLGDDAAGAYVPGINRAEVADTGDVGTDAIDSFTYPNDSEANTMGSCWWVYHAHALGYDERESGMVGMHWIDTGSPTCTVEINPIGTDNAKITFTGTLTDNGTTHTVTLNAVTSTVSNWSVKVQRICAPMVHNGTFDPYIG